MTMMTKASWYAAACIAVLSSSSLAHAGEADVIEAKVNQNAAGTYDFSVTVQHSAGVGALMRYFLPSLTPAFPLRWPRRDSQVLAEQLGFGDFGAKEAAAALAAKRSAKK